MPVIPAFGPWVEQDHKSPKQEKAVASAQKAQTTPVSVDTAAQAAVFWGSGKNPYQTTLCSCTCMEFVRFKVPCKHIYRLAMELGIIDLPYESGKSKGERLSEQMSFESALSLIKGLSVTAQKQAWQMLSQQIAYRHVPHLITDPVIIKEFRACSLFKENPYPAAEILNTFKRDELASMAAESGVANPPKRNAGKAVFVSWILENISDLPQRLPAYASFSFIPNFDMAQCKMITFLNYKFVWNEEADNNGIA